MLLLFLITLKQGGHWDILGHVFQISGLTFEIMMSKYVTIISSHLYDLLVTKISSEFSLFTLIDAQQKFQQIPEALYAVDVTFQQSYCPSGSLPAGKIFFSGKHKLYRVKVEVCVVPNGLAINCCNHYPGIVSDFEIVQRRKDMHEKLLKKKKACELSMSDLEMHYEQYPNSWAVLMDKGYQLLQELLRNTVYTQI